MKTVFNIIIAAILIYCIVLVFRIETTIARAKRNQPTEAVRMMREIAAIVQSAHDRATGITEKEVLYMEDTEKCLNSMGWQYRDDLDQWVNGSDFILANMKDVHKAFADTQGGQSLSDFLTSFHYPAYAN